MRPLALRPAAIPAVLLWVFALAGSLAAATAWTPMTPEEAAQTDSKIEPGAGAEILFLRISIDDSNGRYAEYKYHLRVKLLNAKGVEDFLRHQIEYSGTSTVSRIEGRTYKPDGTVLTLEKKSILDQQVVRTDAARVRAKVVALPGLEPGCVVELRWTIEHDNVAVISMVFQDRYPARLIAYEFYSFEGMGLESVAFNYRGPEPKLDSRGRYQLQMTDVKSYRDEPYDPPTVQSKSWLVVWYTSDTSATVEEYWTKFSASLHRSRESQASPRKNLTDLAQSLTAGAPDEKEKLRRLYAHCTDKIKNPVYAYAGYTPEQRKKLEPNQTAADTLKHGYGSGYDINCLFIALARSLGIDARLALVGDRDGFLPSLKARQGILLRHAVVAVPNGTAWTFLDPGSIFLPFGMLRPENEGMLAFLSDPKKATHAFTPMTPPEASVKRRSAKLALNPEGDLSGTVTLDYTGLRAYELKIELEDESPEKRIEIVRKDVTDLLPLAEVSELKIDGVDATAAPVSIAFKLRVPQFADRTGQRLIFQPAVFQKGQPAYFTAEKRENRISFRRAQTTYDEIRIDLPPGFKLEEATAPVPHIDLGPFGKYRTRLAAPKSGDVVLYQRELNQRFALIGPEHYPEIKRVFDILHTQDNHTLSVLETPAPAEATPPAAPPRTP